MSLFYLRPFIFFLIEIGLAYFVYKRGVRYKFPIIYVLLGLAFYQLGEFIILNSDLKTEGLLLAFASTTILPPLGIYLFEKITGKKAFFEIFMAIGIGFILILFSNPDVVVIGQEKLCFSKFTTLDPYLFNSWGFYYLGTMLLTIFTAFWYSFKHFKIRKDLYLGILTYLLFFPTSYLLVALFDFGYGYITSVMCALAILGAFCLTYLSSYK